MLRVRHLRKGCGTAYREIGRGASKIGRSAHVRFARVCHVVTPDGDIWTYEGGAPGLGVSGSGDVLVGVVGVSQALTSDMAW